MVFEMSAVINDNWLQSSLYRLIMSVFYVKDYIIKNTEHELYCNKQYFLYFTDTVLGVWNVEYVPVCIIWNQKKSKPMTQLSTLPT